MNITAGLRELIALGCITIPNTSPLESGGFTTDDLVYRLPLDRVQAAEKELKEAKAEEEKNKKCVKLGDKLNAILMDKE